MKKHILATTGKFGLGLSVAFLMAPSLASAEVSANVSVVSNYLFRAVSQTGGATAVQGGLDYGHESGFYAGAWG